MLDRLKLKLANIAFKALASNTNPKSYEVLNPYIYPWLGEYTTLFRDENKRNYITQGYEKTPVVFSVISKLASDFANIEVLPFKGEKEANEDPLREYFSRSMSDMTFREHRLRWAIQSYTLGESIMHCPLLTSGNNKGKLMSFQIMPAQHTDIKPRDKFTPVGWYVIDLDGQERKIDPSEVWHSRLFPEQDYENGKNFRGISPIKVAANIIDAMNNGAEITANTLKRGMPPGILGHETVNEGNAQETQRKMEKAWKQKYGNTDRAGIPVFMSGKMNWIPIGFNNFRDLKIIETAEHGLRVFAGVYGVGSRIFNDPRTSNYNADDTDVKRYYESRIIPDHKLYLEGLNKIITPIYGIEYRGIYTDISAFDDDNKDLLEWFRLAITQKAVSRNELRRAMSERFRSIDLEELDIEDMNLTEASFDLGASPAFNSTDDQEDQDDDKTIKY